MKVWNKQLVMQSHDYPDLSHPLLNPNPDLTPDLTPTCPDPSSIPLFEISSLAETHHCLSRCSSRFRVRVTLDLLSRCLWAGLNDIEPMRL